MTTAETTHDHDVVLIPTLRIAPDPANPRKVLRGIDELAESIRLHGVRTPIEVRPDAGNGDGETGWTIITGERRHAAALRAQLIEMPCRVLEETDEVGRAVDRMVENLQRDDFSPLEMAAGVQQILALDVDEAEVATLLSIDPTRVSTARAIAKAKSVPIVSKRFELTFEQAAAFAEFDGQKEIVKDLTHTLETSPEDWAYTVERHREELAEARAVTEEAAKWTEKGYKLIEGRWPAGAQRLNSLRPETGKGTISSAAHSACPGRAVVIIANTPYNRPEPEVSVTEYCLDPKANGHKVDVGGLGSSGSRRADNRSEKEKEADTAKRRIHLAALNAGRTAQALRRQFVADLLKRKSAPAGMLRFAVDATVDHRIDPEPTIHELTGQDGKTSGWSTQETKARKALEKYAAGKTEAQLGLVLFALAASDVEAAWELNTWSMHATHPRKALRKAYLELLVKLGYAPSTVEKVLLGTAKPADVLAESDRIKAAAKASAKATPAKKAVPVKRAPAKKRAVRRRAAARR